MARRPPPMTRWEAGQILIDCNDKLCDKCEELKDNGYPELAEKLEGIKRQIGDLFNSFGSHEFGLPGTVTLERPACCENPLRGSTNDCENCGRKL